MRRFVISSIVTLTTIGAFAAPTTKPTAKVQPLSERDSVLVTNDTGKFKIRLPKEWKATEQNPASLSYETSPAKRDGTRGGEVYIFTGSLCHPGASLDEQVKSNLDLWQKDYKGFRLLKQERTELGGLPAMAVNYDRDYELVFENGKTHKRTVIPRKERAQAIFCINGDKAYFVQFTIDSADFEMKVKLVNRVLAGFEWLEQQQPAAIAPTSNASRASGAQPASSAGSASSAQADAPSKPKTYDADLTLVEDAKIKYRIALPKTWKQQQKSDNDVLFTLPVASGAFTRLGAFRIGAYPLCQPDSTLDLEVKNTHDLIAKREGTKVVKEQRTELAGVPAHMMIFESPYEGTITDSRKGTQKVQRTQRQLYYMAVRNKALFQISFGHDSAEYDNKLKSVEQAIRSLEFTDQSNDTPSTKPSDLK